MINIQKSTRITFALGILSAIALVISNFALMDIQHGSGFTLEWTIMHISYGVFILFHISAIVTLAGMLRRENERRTEQE